MKRGPEIHVRHPGPILDLIYQGDNPVLFVDRFDRYGVGQSRIIEQEDLPRIRLRPMTGERSRSVSESVGAALALRLGPTSIKRILGIKVWVTRPNLALTIKEQLPELPESSLSTRNLGL